MFREEMLIEGGDNQGFDVEGMEEEKGGSK